MPYGIMLIWDFHKLETKISNFTNSYPIIAMSDMCKNNQICGVLTYKKIKVNILI